VICRRRRAHGHLGQLEQLDDREIFWHSVFRIDMGSTSRPEAPKIVHRVMWIAAYSYDTSTSWTEIR
jgi:hypothetical protein